MGSPPGFFITGLQFFHKTIKQKTAGWRFTRGFVTPALRPAFCGFAAMLRRKALQMPQAVFERGSNISCNSKNKRPPDGGSKKLRGLPGDREPRFASDSLRICCYTVGAKLFKSLTAFERVRTQTATAKTKDRRMAVCPGIRNPRFAPDSLRICCYTVGAKLFKSLTAFERGSNTSCNSKNKRPPGGGLLFLVEHRGIEPLTSRLRTLRSPS